MKEITLRNDWHASKWWRPKSLGSAYGEEIINDRGKIGESHPQARRILWVVFTLRDRATRLNQSEGESWRARKGYVPPSDKGTWFYASLSSIRAVYSSRLGKPTISRLLMSVINGHLRAAKPAGVCVFQ